MVLEQNYEDNESRSFDNERDVHVISTFSRS
jgi:hypothetical protein